MVELECPRVIYPLLSFILGVHWGNFENNFAQWYPFPDGVIAFLLLCVTSFLLA